MAAPRVDNARGALPATLVELAEHRLRDAILSGALAPGEKVVEEQLCAVAYAFLPDAKELVEVDESDTVAVH